MSKLFSVFGHVLSILLQLIIFFYFFYFQKNLIGNVLSFISSNSFTCISFNTSLNLNLKFFFVGVCVAGCSQGCMNPLAFSTIYNIFTIPTALPFNLHEFLLLLLFLINHVCVCMFVCMFVCVWVCNSLIRSIISNLWIYIMVDLTLN